MCTAATYTAGDHYFGRNLDLELSYGEKVTITPRNFPLTFRKM
ncbi:linear amide C-N hydrolase, partial [Limosilactobacillus mucosae]